MLRAASEIFLKRPPSMRASRDIRVELATELLHSAGEIRSVARGGSMLPTIFPGDTLEIRTRRFENATAGDIALVIIRGHLCTHRVVREEFRLGRRVLITRGDSLPIDDPDPVREEHFLGSVEFIVRRDRRFRPGKSRAGLGTILQTILQHSPRLRAGVLHFHSLLTRLNRCANDARFGTKLSGDVA